MTDDVLEKTKANRSSFDVQSACLLSADPRLFSESGGRVVDAVRVESVVAWKEAHFLVSRRATAAERTETGRLIGTVSDFNN